MGLVKSQWGCLKRQWGSLSIGLLQGIVSSSQCTCPVILNWFKMATADDNSGFKVEMLTAENYFSWKFNMKMFLIGKDLLEIVTRAETLPGTASQEEQKDLKGKSCSCIRMFFRSFYQFTDLC